MSTNCGTRVTGAGVCVLTVNSPIFTGPLSSALGGADLSWLLGLPVAAAMYFVLARREVEASAAVPAEHYLEAAKVDERAAIHEGLIPTEIRPQLDAVEAETTS